VFTYTANGKGQAYEYLVVFLCILTAGGLLFASCGRIAGGEPVNVLRRTMTDIEGNKVDLSKYLGRVVMIVNVASKCGFTPQYAALETLYQEYKDRGFVILGFPSNDFMRQEPGSNEEIKSFCSLNYGVTFPLFSKIKVVGGKKAPLYDDLASKRTNPNHGGMIKWNFTKFLIGRDGTVIDRFSPNTLPDSKEVRTAIERALQSAAEVGISGQN